MNRIISYRLMRLKKDFLKKTLFKLCVLSSTWLHLVYPLIKLRKISDARTDGRTNERTDGQFNYLPQTSRALRAKITTTKDPIGQKRL